MPFMLTIATLTGAVGVALGDRYCGIMGNNDEIISKFIDAKMSNKKNLKRNKTGS